MELGICLVNKANKTLEAKIFYKKFCYINCLV